MEDRRYIAIDLKSFYASVECMDRGLDPMITNLVVADPSRTEKTICLAVSPSLKAYGIPGRPRLFEVVQKVKEANIRRKQNAPGKSFSGASIIDSKLKSDTSLAIDYIVAPPQMARYMKISSQIYQVYLKYIAPEDIHVYSIDEVFMDVTGYLRTYGMSPRELAMKMILDVLKTTGITATAGIGTNLYLCKVAMDIEAKHIPADSNGVRIAELDEMSYRRSLWDHRPLTDFWRVGRGYQKKLKSVGLYTMGDIARCSVGSSRDYYNEDLLYKLFGVNAELLIDHAWGWEPDQVVLTVGYDVDNLKDPEHRDKYHGEIKTDRYGREIPKHAHGTGNMKQYTSSSHLIIQAVLDLYDRIMDRDLLVRRINLVATHVIPESEARQELQYEQLSLFTDYSAQEKQAKKEEKDLEKERKMQEAMLEIKKKFGKNAILKGMNLQEGATAKERNSQIGGHKA